MDIKIDEIADRIYRLSSFVPQVAPPEGFTFNQFLLAAEEPLLFHCGHRHMFPHISAAVARVVPLEKLRWIAFSHLEADECGAMNEWLAAAPNAEIAHGQIGCRTSLNDMADRRPRALADGETIDLGGLKVRHLDTPHVPHGWDARMLFEETTGTLLCSDVFAHAGQCPPLTTSDIVAPAIANEEKSRAMSLTPTTAPTLRRLGALRPRTLALMHGSSFAGDAATAFEALAQYVEEQLKAA